MKKFINLLIVVLCSTATFGQVKEKIKGSKIVAVKQQEVKEFKILEVENDLEIFLIKGDKSALEIEADDNLHDVIDVKTTGTTLQLSTNKEVSGAKKMSIRVTYTDDFSMIIIKDRCNVTALATLKVNDFTIKSFDESKVFVNAETKNFTLMANDKSKIQLNLKSTTATIELSKNANFKGLLTSPQLVFDMYQKTTAVVEGDCTDLKLRLDNDADFTGKNLTCKNAELSLEGNSDGSIMVNTNVTISASGTSELQLYGIPKIEITNFADKATLYKKVLK